MMVYQNSTENSPLAPAAEFNRLRNALSAVFDDLEMRAWIARHAADAA